MIKKITIKNFRSIELASIDCSNVTVFVGRNDAGKSNVLRALNLFFNGKTDHGVEFNFDNDFSYNSVVRAKKAKEISIELIIEVPGTYRRLGFPDQVVWRKVWRASGLHAKGGIQQYVDGQVFPSRSRLPGLLGRIRYDYVPAIKDRRYFADLQGQVYDVLASVAEEKLHKSAVQFESNIQEHLRELLDSVSEAFKVNSVMKLPKNLREIFESLEFDSEGIPLSRRGDGVKIRHIPKILRFAAEKRNSIGRSGMCPHIWGFEEPENNVELLSCFEMAQEFMDVSRSGYQVFLTTHSPAFYALGDCQDEKHVLTYHVTKEGGSSSVKLCDRSQADSEMGLMPLVAPFVRKERDRWEEKLRKERAAIEEFQKEVDQNKPRLFVEGESDRIVVERALYVFFGISKSDIRVDCCRDGYGGANAVCNRAYAWQLNQQHRTSPVRGAALFDDDEAGKRAADSLEESLRRGRGHRHVKGFRLEGGKRIILLKKNCFRVPVDLEMLYADWVWEYAESKGWLVDDESLPNVLPHDKLYQAVKCGYRALEGLDEFDRIRLEKKFTDPGKLAAAKFVGELPDEKVIEALEDLKRTLEKVVHFLLPDFCPQHRKDNSFEETL